MQDRRPAEEGALWPDLRLTKAHIALVRARLAITPARPRTTSRRLCSGIPYFPPLCVLATGEVEAHLAPWWFTICVTGRSRTRQSDLDAMARYAPVLLLEPYGHPAAKPFKDARVADGIPFTSFAVDDVKEELDRLRALGVRFTQEPLEAGPVTTAVLDDACGNLIQIASMN
jgi:hypothetical protein